MFFVHYADGYYSNGDVGVAEFIFEEDALTFITDRMSEDEDRVLDMYILVEGKKLKMVPWELVTKITIDYT